MFLNRITLNEKAVFADNLSVMLKSGLSIIDALDILADQASGRFRRVIAELSRAVAAGNGLGGSLRRFPGIFSHFLINTVEAGESSGNLAENLSDAAGQMAKEKELKDKIKGAMVYPLLILILSFVVGLGLSFFVLPKITPMFAGLKMELPVTTRFLIWFSDVIQHYGFLLLAVLAGLLAFTVWLLKQKFVKPFSHFIFLHLPVIKKLSRGRNLAQFSRTLGTLLKSGLTINESLIITANSVGNYYFRKSLLATGWQINYGGKLSAILAEHGRYFPRLAVSLIGVGEKSGKLEEELFNLARIYETEVDRAAKALAVAVEPMLLIIIGLVVGGLALSIITPIYKITGGIYG